MKYYLIGVNDWEYSDIKIKISIDIMVEKNWIYDVSRET